MKITSFHRISPITTVNFWLYDVIRKIINREERSGFRHRKQALPEDRTTRTGIPPLEKRPAEGRKRLKMAVICDQMSFLNLREYAHAVFLTPGNWYEVMETLKPDLFWCESAWTGIDGYGSCWRGKIYRNERVAFENRRELFHILDYCREKKISTAFWNKEDPVFFDAPRYNFSDTALRFDTIFTTDEECVEKYGRLGHSSVSLLPFGFSPRLFNPVERRKRSEAAVFAGSWYSNHRKRCQDMMEVFALLEREGIEPVIYDRAGRRRKDRKFPETLQAFIHGYIPYEELGERLKQFRYGININTVQSSETMFARRVYELMACNLCVISNPQKGLEQMFPGHIWFSGQPFDRSRVQELCGENVDFVFAAHTNGVRMGQILKTLGLERFCGCASLLLLSWDDLGKTETAPVFLCCDGITYHCRRGVLGHDSVYLEDGRTYGAESVAEKFRGGYFCMVSDHMDIPYAKILPHFSYIGERCGIGRRKSKSDSRYLFERNRDNGNIIFPMQFLEEFMKDMTKDMEKYYV